MRFATSLLLATSFIAPLGAASLLVDNGQPTNAIAVATRPAGGVKTEIEAADDFTLSGQASITSLTFTGILTGASPSIGAVNVEFYNIFPLNSVNPPAGTVPTRVNSPSDTAFLTKNSLTDFTFGTSFLTAPNGFTSLNSVFTGINPSPNSTTGGEGSISGTEVQFTINFTTPFLLDAGHYFFVPEVQVTGGEFYWLSSTLVPSGLDLQTWVRGSAITPNWLRVGTDIIGGTTPPKYDMVFTISGNPTATPEPSSAALVLTGLAGLLYARRRRS